MQRFMSDIASETGLATYGLEEIQKALNYGAVDILLLSEKIDKYRVKLGCANCNYSEVRIIKQRLFNKFKGDIQQESCPNCGSNGFKIIDKISLIEKLNPEWNDLFIQLCDDD